MDNQLINFPKGLIHFWPINKDTTALFSLFSSSLSHASLSLFCFSFMRISLLDNALQCILVIYLCSVISLLLCLICIIKPWFALVHIIYLYIISWIRYYSLCVIFYFQEIMWERWVYRNLWENGSQTRIKVELKDHA